ncbi:MAG: hypothetical protein A2161_15275 [Candidatus Schekmanbacteria bacterium RBG_13_48_7]|uniref:Uncharacterized protein n=1 Tax=Candidatus Schekmanbacteria bacterium RBG_13_48_7 TaxID=1817878 RepID=A0A1F7RP09_9BACT|nr:MAG: hypothetical protein A2161_15275 [Candidatus Schekmanbacteria bacterium RBG_13_48_7]
MIIDGNTLQGKTHLQGAPKRYKITLAPQKRYKDFIRIALEYDKSLKVQFVKPHYRFRQEYFISKKLLVIPAREKSPFSARELKLINDFVKTGGSLFFMSNHNPYFFAMDFFNFQQSL